MMPKGSSARSIFIITLLTPVAHADVKAQSMEVPDHAGDAERSTDKSADNFVKDLITELLERQLRMEPIHSPALDDTALRKPGHVTIGGNRAALLSQPGAFSSAMASSPLLAGRSPEPQRGCGFACAATHDHEMPEGRRKALTAVLGTLSAATVGTVASNPKPALAAELTDGPDGLKYRDVKAGTGDEAAEGAELSTTYTVKVNGKQIDSARKVFRLKNNAKPKSAKVQVGSFDVSEIKGFRLGLAGGDGMEAMKVGGSRQLVVPANLGYGGEEGGCWTRALNRGGYNTICLIPPNSNIDIQVKLVSVKK